jgi:hypothetical protein
MFTASAIDRDDSIKFSDEHQLPKGDPPKPWISWSSERRSGYRDNDGLFGDELGFFADNASPTSRILR